MRRRFPMWGASPWPGLRPRPPDLCISDRCWRRSAVTSTHARTARAGWCASRIWIRRASFRVVPTTCCALSKRSASNGMATCCSRARGAPPTQQALEALSARRTYRLQLLAQGSRGCRRRGGRLSRHLPIRAHEGRTHRGALPRRAIGLSTSTICTSGSSVSISLPAAIVVRAVAMASRATSLPWSSTMRFSPSRGWCAAPTCWRAPPGRSSCSRRSRCRTYLRTPAAAHRGGWRETI